MTDISFLCFTDDHLESILRALPTTCAATASSDPKPSTQEAPFDTSEASSQLPTGKSPGAAGTQSIGGVCEQTSVSDALSTLKPAVVVSMSGAQL